MTIVEEMNAGAAGRKPRQPLYTAEQIRAMLADSALWHEQLRAAASSRGASFTSVTPMAEVMAWLHTHASEARECGCPHGDGCPHHEHPSEVPTIPVACEVGALVKGDRFIYQGDTRLTPSPRSTKSYPLKGRHGVVVDTYVSGGGHRMINVDFGKGLTLAMPAEGPYEKTEAKEPAANDKQDEQAARSVLARGDKPLKIEKVKGGWTVHVHGDPVIAGAKGLTWKGRPGYDGGVDGFGHEKPPHKFKTRDEARTVAHQIGRYVLNLGDFAYTYVEGWGK